MNNNLQTAELFNSDKFDYIKIIPFSIVHTNGKCSLNASFTCNIFLISFMDKQKGMILKICVCICETYRNFNSL